MSQDVKQLRVKIFDELSKIVDPEINTTITELELVDEVDIADESVKVDLHLTSPFCPAVFGFKICQDIHDNLLSIDGIDDVKVNVAELKDGLLTISCERIVPEHKKKKLIEIK